MPAGSLIVQVVVVESLGLRVEQLPPFVEFFAHGRGFFTVSINKKVKIIRNSIRFQITLQESVSFSNFDPT